MTSQIWSSVRCAACPGDDAPALHSATSSIDLARTPAGAQA